MNNYTAKIKLRCVNGSVKVTFNINADLVLDGSKSLEQLEKEIVADLGREYSHIAEYTIDLRLKGKV